MQKFLRTRRTSTRTGRSRVLAAGAGLACLVLLGACTSTDQSATVRLVRQDRAAYGVRTVIVDSGTQRTAQQHTLAMARSRTLYHSSLYLSTHQCAKGENVGYGGSITQVEQAFMRSSGHRANILNSRYDHIGVGVVRSGGLVWVVEQFVDVC